MKLNEIAILESNTSKIEEKITLEEVKRFVENQVKNVRTDVTLSLEAGYIETFDEIVNFIESDFLLENNIADDKGGVPAYVALKENEEIEQIQELRSDAMHDLINEFEV